MYLTPGGQPYRNGSHILIDEIEGDDGALLCITDLVQCCRSGIPPVKVELWGSGFIPIDHLFVLKTVVMTFIVPETLVLCV